jgi:hypothetical protein
MARLEKLLIITLFAVTCALRFIHLGYSDYISDEPGTFFYRGGKKDPEMTKTEFILTQRKGPLQLFVGYVPYSIVGNYDNELAQRLPFAIFNVAAIMVFYALVRKITKSPITAFVSALVLSTNGLITAFGRVAQYQSLNMFFSFLSLYFFANLLDTTPEAEKKYLKSSILGSIAFCFSFLAHWDAVYYLIPTLFMVATFFLRARVPNTYKFKLALYNILVVALLTLPFMIPYIAKMQSLPDNVSYAQSRIALLNPFEDRQNIFRFELYNPFVAPPLYVIGTTLGIFGSLFLVLRKKASTNILVFAFWFVGVFFVFRFFVAYTGSHFYNYFIPATILVGVGAHFLFSLFHNLTPKIRLLIHLLLGLCVGLILAFLTYQTYLLFVDHKLEYPWQQEKILSWETREYTHKDEMRHKIGFTHKRYWSEVNDFVNEQNRINGENFGYYTNEYPQVPKYYMKETEFRGGDGGYYAIGVKRPQSFATDYKFSQIKGKYTVKKIENEEGSTVVQIYRVEEEAE